MNPRRSLWLARIAAPIALLAVACARTPAPESNAAASDPKAVAIADEVMRALGGKDAWDRLHGLRWTFEVAVNDTLRPARRHAWDKMTGWQRVEGTSRTGTAYCFIGNLDSGEGHAWMDMDPIEGDSLAKLVKRSRSMWINDSYWFLMPYKLRDPGAMLKYDGDTLVAGATYDRLALSFKDVGDTPGDHYWVYVNRANHRVERWDMVLQGDAPPAKSYTWEGWEEHDGLWFATAHRQDNTVIYTRNIETVSAFGDKEFSAP